MTSVWPKSSSNFVRLKATPHQWNLMSVRFRPHVLRGKEQTWTEGHLWKNSLRTSVAPNQRRTAGKATWEVFSGWWEHTEDLNASASRSKPSCTHAPVKLEAVILEEESYGHWDFVFVLRKYVCSMLYSAYTQVVLKLRCVWPHPSEVEPLCWIT